MTKILTDAQYQEQFNADELKGIAKEVFYVGDREEVYHGCDRYVNNRCDRVLELRHGLLLRIYSFECLQDLTIEVDLDWSEILSLSFFVMGDMHTHLQGITEQVNETAGNGYLMYCPGVPETEGWKANQKILRVKIEIEPSKFFQDLSLEQFDFLPKQLKPFATQDPVAPFYFQQKISAEIPSILQQILNCPYQGAMKQWYLEAKALELLTIRFNQIQESTSNSFTKLQLPNLDRIYQAREILLQNWLDPPSIIEIAQRVGMYHMKLKQGFKDVFGTTPFNYLREFRLEKARELLQDSQLTIVAVANAVGYANPGHFAAAFKRKYGMTPREFKFK